MTFAKGGVPHAGSRQGCSLVAVGGLLIAVASHTAEHRLWAVGLQSLPHVSSIVAAHRLSFSEACGIFSDQGLTPCLLHW